jgi:hypothetical protein
LALPCPGAGDCPCPFFAEAGQKQDGGRGGTPSLKRFLSGCCSKTKVFEQLYSFRGIFFTKVFTGGKK